MKLSLQQVHSRPLIQTTGVRGLFSIACAICGTKAGPSPSEVAVSEQYFIRLRRVMPWRRIAARAGGPRAARAWGGNTLAAAHAGSAASLPAPRWLCCAA